MLINHRLMNIISYCDGGFMYICCMCNPPVSREANALSRAAAVCFHLGLTGRIVGKVSVGYLLGRALKVSVGYFFEDSFLACWSR